MDSRRDGSGRPAPRESRRARRVRRAVALAALGAAASMASAQAAQHERSVAAMQAELECVAGVELGYEVDYVNQLGGYAVSGMGVVAHTAGCAGRPVVVVLVDASGATLATGGLTLAEGASVRFDSGGPVDARDVAAVRVLADR